MNLRKMLPAALLLVAAACASSTATETETQSVGLNPAKKSCCSKEEAKNCTAEQKAACEKAGMECTDKKPEAEP